MELQKKKEEIEKEGAGASVSNEQQELKAIENDF